MAYLQMVLTNEDKKILKEAMKFGYTNAEQILNSHTDEHGATLFFFGNGQVDKFVTMISSEQDALINVEWFKDKLSNAINNYIISESFNIKN